MPPFRLLLLSWNYLVSYSSLNLFWGGGEGGDLDFGLSIVLVQALIDTGVKILVNNYYISKSWKLGELCSDMGFPVKLGGVTSIWHGYDVRIESYRRKIRN